LLNVVVQNVIWLYKFLYRDWISNNIYFILPCFKLTKLHDARPRM